MLRYTYDQLHGALKASIVTVTFTKLNGQKRVMRCTLDPLQIPESEQPNHDPATPAPSSKLDENGVPISLRVFEPAINEWRAFRLDSVLNFEYLGIVIKVSPECVDNFVNEGCPND